MREGNATQRAARTGPVDDRKPITFNEFSNENVPPREQCDALNDYISPVATITPAGNAKQGFQAIHRAVSIEPLSLVNYRRGAAWSERDARAVRKNGSDTIAIVALREGAFEGQTGSCDYSLKPGGVLLRDTTLPYRNLSTAVDVLTLEVPREMVSGIVGNVGLVSGRVYHAGGMGLLHDYLSSLFSVADSLTDAAAQHITAATQQLLTVALAPTRDALVHAEAPLAELLRRRAQTYIARNIFSEDLTPDRISAAVGVSRRKLYQLFESEGGIARYVVGLRLDRARDVLATNYRIGLIKEVAFSHGFKSEAHFSRCFRARFDHSPSESREAARAQLRGPV
jgi:AraC-like DNA-binding protein